MWNRMWNRMGLISRKLVMVVCMSRIEIKT